MTIRLAGEAGQGVESGGAGFAQALSHGGLWLHAYSEYMSRIRGGLNFFQVRVSGRPLWSHTEGVHILLAFSPEAVTDYGPDIVRGGALVFDEGLKFDHDAVTGRGAQLYGMPLLKIAQETGGNNQEELRPQGRGGRPGQPQGRPGRVPGRPREVRRLF